MTHSFLTRRYSDLVKVLLDSLQSLPDAPFNLPFPTEPRLLEVCLTIQSAPHLAHTLDESAGLARMSSRTFTRHFLRATGLPSPTWQIGRASCRESVCQSV